MSRRFEFRERWTVAAPRDRVAALLLDLEHYPDGWPQVLAVAKLGPDTARVLCRSALPYTHDLVLDAVSREAPVLEVAVSGDLEGWVRWTLAPTEGGTRTDFAQEVAVTGALALSSYVARPLLRWNHHRMMRGCEEGLHRRLVAQRA